MNQHNLYLRKRLGRIIDRLKDENGGRIDQILSEAYPIIEKLTTAREAPEAVPVADDFVMLDDREIYKIYRKSFIKNKAIRRIRERQK